MKYLIIIKYGYGIPNQPDGWYNFLTEYNPSLETFNYGFSEHDLKLLLNQENQKNKKKSPVLFDNKEEAKKVAKIAKIYEIAKATDIWKPLIKKFNFYVISDNGDEIEEI